MTYEKQLQEAVDLIAQYGTAGKAHKAIDGRIAKTTIHDRAQKGLALGYVSTVTPDPEEVQAEGITEADLLKNEIKTLKNQVNLLSKNSISAEKIRREILNITELKNNMTFPEWTVPDKSPSTPSASVPVLFCSDWHWGEVIDPKQMGNCNNEYNLTIARERVGRLITNTIDLLFKHILNPNYPGLVIVLGGDMFSGDIHEELSQSNDAPTMLAMLDLYGVLINMIAEFKKYFPKIFVVGVSGNHSRTTHKTQHKNRCYTSFDWLMYQYLMLHHEKDKDIAFLVPDGPDAYFKVLNHRFLLTHGDQFKGGKGLMGSLGPILRGNALKQMKQAALGYPYDTILVGHFHRYFALMEAIGNGSLCGYGEYADQANFGYEIPQQALFLVHALRGITINMGVQVDEPVSKESIDQWVSVLKQ
jgi:hypothetical protein